MKPQVNINVVVDVMGALSDQTLVGNLCLADDGAFHSTGQGTPELCTIVVPGQVVKWTALAVDVQTPVEIKRISFLDADGRVVDDPRSDTAKAAAPDEPDADRLDLNDWTGVVPVFMPNGTPQRYRLELQMGGGEHGFMHVDSPALMRL